MLSQMNPGHTLTPHFTNTRFNISNLCLHLPSSLFPSGFPPKILYEFRTYPPLLGYSTTHFNYIRYIAFDGRITASDELKRIRNEAAAAYLKYHLSI